MSATVVSFISSPGPTFNPFRRIRKRKGTLYNTFLPSLSSSLTPTGIVFNGYPYGSIKRKSIFTGVRPFCPVMEWQECTVKKEVDVPISVAYNCYSDREAIPRWMPFISSVKGRGADTYPIPMSACEVSDTGTSQKMESTVVLWPPFVTNHWHILEDKPDLSRWSLKYRAFGRNIEFSWLARNMQPIPNQKIHWRSLEGLPNRGAVRFFPKGPSSCIVELTVSYEVPQILAPVASALKPFLENLLVRGLERFVRFAETY